jgi:hypothetical protein
MRRSCQLSYAKRDTFNIKCRLNWHRKISTANIHRRLLIWETEKKRQDYLNIKTQNTINITLDGTVKQGIAGVTTPLDCAKGEYLPISYHL